jgi:hypothetical protein
MKKSDIDALTKLIRANLELYILASLLTDFQKEINKILKEGRKT